MLLLLSAAHALSIPVRATFTEEVAPGEVPIVGAATSAAIAGISDPTTGGSFPLSDEELTINKRQASGKETLRFVATPKSSIRTWALYFLDAEGGEIGAPEVVDVSFDELGNGSVAARGASSRLGSLSVKAGATKKDGDYGATVKVEVQDSGVSAAYIGIVELTNTDADATLLCDPDMTVMDAAVYASFQGIGLDAIVALDTWSAQLEGTVDVSGLAVDADGTVEAGDELRWDLAFYTGAVSCEKGGVCRPIVADSRSYLEPIGKVKKKTGAAAKVTLRAGDELFDTTDASFDLTFQGDVRDLEVSAAMDVFTAGQLTTGRDVVALDPGGFGVKADDDDDTGIIIDIFIDMDTDVLGDDDSQAPPKPWETMATQVFDVVVIDSSGAEVATHPCQLHPTSNTLAGTSVRDVLVGECARSDGDTEVRRLRASIGAAGWVRWTIDMAGPTFASERTLSTCEKGGSCTAQTVSVLGGRVELQHDGAVLLSRTIKVEETDFDLPFLFDADIDGSLASVAIDVYSTAPVTWSVVKGVVTATGDDGVIASFDVDDVGLEPTGDLSLRGWEVDTATAPKERSIGPVTLGNKTGAGQFKAKRTGS